MGLLGDIVGSFTGKNDRKAADAYAAAEAGQRLDAKRMQYDLLAKRRAPKLTMQQEARIKALEDESKLGLEQDPNFQSQLRQARVGGAQSLASMQNNQAATGAGGGFQNIGSAADIYDRLGVQLAELAGQQQQYRDQKRDTAADMRQAAHDAQLEFDNAMIEAQMAIEANDAAAASQALARASQARAAAQNKMLQNLGGIGGLAVGFLSGNPASAAGSGVIGNKGGASTLAGPTQASYQQQQSGTNYYLQDNPFTSTVGSNSKANLPWYAQSGRY